MRSQDLTKRFEDHDKDEDIRWFRAQIRKLLYRPGDIRMLSESKRIVRLFRQCDPPRSATEWRQDVWWDVEDLIEGGFFQVPQRSLGPRMAEMEVVAWVAADNSDDADEGLPTPPGGQRAGSRASDE